MADKTIATIRDAAAKAAKARKAERDAWNLAVESFAAHLSALPDNPKIQKRYAGPAAFVVSSSALAQTGTWSIFTLDFVAQRKRLAEIARGIADAPARNIAALRSILANLSEADGKTIRRYPRDAIAASKKQIEALAEAAEAVFGAPEPR